MCFCVLYQKDVYLYCITQHISPIYRDRKSIVVSLFLSTQYSCKRQFRGDEGAQQLWALVFLSNFISPKHFNLFLHLNWF